MKSIADRLRHARQLAGLSQEELAKRSGCSQSTIGNIEAGTRQRPREIVSIAKALNFNADWLETGKGAPQGAPLPELEWPFELLTREQRSMLSERQCGAVESAAVKAYQHFTQRPD